MGEKNSPPSSYETVVIALLLSPLQVQSWGVGTWVHTCRASPPQQVPPWAFPQPYVALKGLPPLQEGVGFLLECTWLLDLGVHLGVHLLKPFPKATLHSYQRLLTTHPRGKWHFRPMPGLTPGFTLFLSSGDGGGRGQPALPPLSPVPRSFAPFKSTIAPLSHPLSGAEMGLPWLMHHNPLIWEPLLNWQKEVKPDLVVKWLYVPLFPIGFGSQGASFRKLDHLLSSSLPLGRQTRNQPRHAHN